MFGVGKYSARLVRVWFVVKESNSSEIGNGWQGCDWRERILVFAEDMDMD
jgi:hypothetical protein